MNFIFAGLLLVAAGIYRTIADRKANKVRNCLHAHQCWQCGTVWRHRAADIDDNGAAHACPKCGVFQFRVMPEIPVAGRGDETPHAAGVDDPREGKRAATQPPGDGALPASGAIAAPAKK